MLMDSHLTMQNQVTEIKKKSFNTIRKINKAKHLLSTDHLKTIVNGVIVSCLDYCNALYYGIGQKLLCQLQQIQNAAAKLIMGKNKYDHVDKDLQKLHWLSVKKRIIFKIALLVYKSLNGLAPPYLQELFSYAHHGHLLRLETPCTYTRFGPRALKCNWAQSIQLPPFQCQTSS